MYLFDTNIFLEILLSQKKSNLCKKELSDNASSSFISDFSLHSIGVILFRHHKESVFNDFIKDLLPMIDIVTLSSNSYGRISDFKEKYGLDFDDSYQSMIAVENRVTIVTMDRDFKRVEDEISVKFI